MAYPADLSLGRGVFIGVQGGVIDLIKSVTCHMLAGQPIHVAGRPSSPASTDFKVWIPCYRLLESMLVKQTREGMQVGSVSQGVWPTGHPLVPLVSGFCTLPPPVKCIPVVTLILVEFQFSLVFLEMLQFGTYVFEIKKTLKLWN
jgi:hypothetical protein